MAKNNNLKDFVTGVAGAIREKKGTTELINPQDFENEILTIQTGVDTSDATATADDIRFGKTAYGADGKMTGTIADYDGTSEPASGKSLAMQIVDRSVTSVSEEDLKGLTKIGDSAFRGCSSLTSITIPDSVTEFDFYAFADCYKLKDINIPENLRRIESYAFEKCSGLIGVYITNLNKWFDISFGGGDSNPLSRAHQLYVNGSHIMDIVIPDGVTELKMYALEGCDATNITIPNSLTRIRDGALSECLGLTNIVVPDSVTMIEAYAFRGCSNLANITLSNNITEIKNNMFYECSSLTNIVIPINVIRIESYAFRYCSSLSSVKLLPTTPPTLSSNVFMGTSADLQIIVPKGTLDAYKSATNWSAYADKMVEADE